MSMTIESLKKHPQQINKVKELYLDSLPQNERIPMNLLLWKAKKDFVDFLVIYDEDVFVGFTYLMTCNDLTYVLYLAIDNNIRSKGYGSRTLTLLKEKYPNNRIILNIEVVDKIADNYEQRLTRRKFYIRNGYKGSTLLYQDRWGLYEVLIYRDQVDKEEFYDLLKRFAGPLLFSIFKPQINLSKELEVTK